MLRTMLILIKYNNNSEICGYIYGEGITHFTMTLEKLKYALKAYKAGLNSPIEYAKASWFI